MALSKDEILDAIAEMSVMDIVVFLLKLEAEKLGA
jgi:ribosomal protein L7/L12